MCFFFGDGVGRSGRRCILLTIRKKISKKKEKKIQYIHKSSSLFMVKVDAC